MFQSEYIILPINYKKISSGSYLLTNDAGEYYYLSADQLEDLLAYKLSKDDKIYMDLVSGQYISENNADISTNLSATKLRTRKGFLRNFTSLHMMVITLRCNQKCEYCQVSCEDEEAHKYDMTLNTCEKIVDFILNFPGEDLKIEFQGGEPLLNWDAIVHTVEYAKKQNKNKKINFVICTNLTLINPQQLTFLKENNVAISTSLDGDQQSHDVNRKLRIGKSSYNLFTEKLRMTKELYGNNVCALLTLTRQNLPNIKKIINEYVEHGFEGIFFRALNPYGFASTNNYLNYSAGEFVAAYIEGLEHIIELNKNGIHFVEYYTQLLLTRIFTSFPTGFVDLQSPSGVGIGGVIYDYNGNIFPADEARMLSRMNNNYFLIGNVYNNSFGDFVTSEILHNVVKQSCIESIPGCAWCAFMPYCGADPIRNYLEYNDLIGHKPSSFFCKKHSGIFDYLFSKIEKATDKEMDILWSWTTNIRN